jgi:hypothetical protein
MIYLLPYLSVVIYIASIQGLEMTILESIPEEGLQDSFE